MIINKCKGCNKPLRYIDINNEPRISLRESTGMCASCRNLAFIYQKNDKSRLEKLKIYGKKNWFTIKWNSLIYRMIKIYEKS